MRKTRTGSGAVAVQVAEKQNGKLEVIQHFGSAHTDAELGVLLEQPRAFVDAGQGMLDLQVPEPVDRIEDVADWRAPGLPLRPLAPSRHGAFAGRISATSSRLVYDALAGVYDRLGFNAVEDQVFKDLVLERIVEPSSKADSLRVLADLGAQPVSYKTIQRHLSMITPGGYRDRIASLCFEHAAHTGGGVNSWKQWARPVAS